MYLQFYTFILLVCSIFLSFPLKAQRTLYSTGQGVDINWLTIENWSEDSTGTSAITSPPTQNDHLVIRHEIFQKVEPNYIHFGNITIGRQGHLRIFSGSGNSEPYIFAGDTCLIQGQLTSSSDFHHQIFGSTGNGVLIFDTFAVVEVGDDLILNAFGQTFMNNPDCGAGGSFDDLYFNGTNAKLCGSGRFVIPDAIRAWDDDNNEVIPSSLQITGQICPEFAIFDTQEACLEDQPIFPVELLDFRATVQGSNVALHWTTLWEMNNHSFTIERSKDGKEYKALSQIPGALNSQEPINYQHIDLQPFNGRSYYRLKQTDLDGKFTYSQIVEASIELPEESLRVFPNPISSQDQLTIQYRGNTKDSSIQLQIMNLAGQIIFTSPFQVNKDGISQFRPSLNLSGGIYFVKLKTNEEVLHQKFVVR